MVPYHDTTVGRKFKFLHTEDLFPLVVLKIGFIVNFSQNHRAPVKLIPPPITEP